MKIKSIIPGLIIACGFSLTTIAQTQLNGAGATFPTVIYSKWFDVYTTGLQQMTSGTATNDIIPTPLGWQTDIGLFPVI